MLGVAPSRRSTTCPRARPTSSSSARRRRPTPTCCGRARRRACGPRSSPRPATARPATRAAQAEAELVALADELGHPAGRSERAGRGVDAVVAVRPDRGAVPAGRAHRRRQPVGQLRVVVHELRGADRRRHQPGGQRRQRGGGRRGRLPRLGTPTTRRRRSASPTSRASPTAGPSSTGCGRRGRGDAARAGEGRRHRRRPAGRGQPHRVARHRRPRLRRRCAARPASTRAATVEEAFEAAATFATQPLPAGPAGRGAHDRRRLGRGHRRRDHPQLARARRPARPTCTPRSTSCCRPGGAATTRSTWPAARPATRSRRCSSSSPVTPTSTRSSSSASASSPTRPR